MVVSNGVWCPSPIFSKVTKDDFKSVLTHMNSAISYFGDETISEAKVNEIADSVFTEFDHEHDSTLSYAGWCALCVQHIALPMVTIMSCLFQSLWRLSPLIPTLSSLCVVPRRRPRQRMKRSKVVCAGARIRKTHCSKQLLLCPSTI